MSDKMMNRRAFVLAAAGLMAPFALRPGFALAGKPARPEHPEPRPGIDASRVVPADQVPSHVAVVFDQIREIPHIADGIRCNCGCADLEEMYSLLSCYEQPGMAQYCMICQGEGKLVARLHKEGKTLAEIRAAIDRRYA